MRKRWMCAGVVALGLFAAVVQAGDDDPFDKRYEIKDLPTERAKKDDAKQPTKRRSPQEILAEKIDFKLEVTPKEAKPGQVVTVKIYGTPKTGTPTGDNYTYPIGKRTSNQTDDQLSRIEYGPPEVFQPLWPVEENPPPEKKLVPLTGEVLKHAHPFTWTQRLLIKQDATPGDKTLTVTIRLQVCDERGCTQPGVAYRPLTDQVRVLEGAVSPDPALLTATQRPAIEVLSAAKPPPPGQEVPTTLLGFLGAAFVGAFLMLLTPCVFPMIPITVNFFLKQSEKEHHNPLAMASVYSGTIIVVLSLAVLLLGNVIIALANDAWFNLVLGAVLVYFALSLFGMYEIELPSFLSRFTSAREGQGGYAGTLFMALTFTITSFTCTGPFLGLMIGSIASVRPPWYHLVLGAVVYATTFAAPFFLLALFPSVIKKLPKSGSWLNAIKVSMGFLELGAALKFLANTDIALNPGNPQIFNYDTVLCSWIALSFACGLYLLGLLRLPHDEPAEHIGVLRMVFATVFIGLAVYMFPALRDKTPPQGLVGEGLVAFLPPSFRETWHLDYIAAWREAKTSNKLIFIDFTGVNCTNCRYNEKNVFPQPEVREELDKYVKLQLYTDTVPNRRLSAARAKEQAVRNQQWLSQWADLTNPTYVIFEPDRDQPFDSNGLPKGRVLNTRNGTIFPADIDGFVQFLQNGQEAVAQAWHADYPEAWREARTTNKLLFLNFTATTDTNSRYNEQNVFPRREVRDQLDRYVKVELYADRIPRKDLPPADAKAQAVRNQQWLEEWANLDTPTYLIFEPDRNQPFDDKGLPKGQVVRSCNGTIFDVGAFVAFLRQT